MPVRCPECGKEHDVTSFPAGKEIQCSCGTALHVSDMDTVGDFLRFFESEEERKKAAALSEEARRICRMILSGETEDVDIRIAIEKLREEVSRLFPDRMEAYEMIYEARFNRLWDQFRRPPGNGREETDS